VIRQLAFDLPRSEAMTRADFFVSPSNALALGMVDDAAHWPLGRLILIGPEGAGKTHLAQVWATGSGARIVSGSGLADHDIAALAEGPVVVDTAEAVAGDAKAETALFHLVNFIAAHHPLLLTARAAPRDWGLGLADLISRLQATAVARLDPPDDALLSAVLAKLFTDRQIAVAANLIPYLVSRMPRQIAAARALVAALDGQALAAGRPITRQLAAEVLDSLSDG
jgi:chromosomal replication initiation ATPase DnaA